MGKDTPVPVKLEGLCQQPTNWVSEPGVARSRARARRGTSWEPTPGRRPWPGRAPSTPGQRAGDIGRGLACLTPWIFPLFRQECFPGTVFCTQSVGGHSLLLRGRLGPNEPHRARACLDSGFEPDAGVSCFHEALMASIVAPNSLF